MLRRGAVAGLAAGAVAQLLVDGGEGSHEWLVRSALMLPALVFIAWWLLEPGVRVDDPGAAAADAPDPAALDRVERIETVFDTAAVPRARRERLEQPEDGLRATYRSSVRRDAPEAGSSSEAWRVRHSVRPASNDGSLG